MTKDRELFALISVDKISKNLKWYCLSVQNIKKIIYANSQFEIVKALKQAQKVKVIDSKHRKTFHWFSTQGARCHLATIVHQ